MKLPAALRGALMRMGLVTPGERISGTSLSGGVSSDIWRLELPSGPVCIKRALPRLKVDAEWRVPVERNSFEVAWMREAETLSPGAVPTVLGEDAQTRSFAMAYLGPDRYPLWKSQLLAGKVSIDFAAKVGEVLGRIHAATADRDDVAARFRTDENFYAIRLEPYLIATAKSHPDVGGILEALSNTTAKVRRVLVHGDVSPKNILAGPSGPVFLDAECAWFGDPAFDLAFCLNHLLLKGIVIPFAKTELLRAFDALRFAYLSAVTWEPLDELEARASRLLPGLLLARVDGKSPVEYLNQARDRDIVRESAKTLLTRPVDRLREVTDLWFPSLAA
ncbi:MAG: aminoglycoside phosphotransferase family protein [Gammaproteobacteria bacterium]|nr:aminoglycoside phosphotransferase family protein [Gammaproteobacteria bacterium]